MPRSPAIHTYDKTCIYHAPETITPVTVESDQAPPVRAQHFYLFPFNIDDVFTPLPPVQAQPHQDGRGMTITASVPPQPFSGLDNAALEKAWEELGSKEVEKRNKRQKALARDNVATYDRGATDPIKITIKSPGHVDLSHSMSGSISDDRKTTHRGPGAGAGAGSSSSDEANAQARGLRLGLLRKESTREGQSQGQSRGPAVNVNVNGHGQGQGQGHMQHNKPLKRQSLQHNPYFSRIPRSTPSLAASAAGSLKDDHQHHHHHQRHPSPPKASAMPQLSNSLTHSPTEIRDRPSIPSTPAPLPTSSSSATIYTSTGAAGTETPPRPSSSAMSTWSGSQTRSRNGSTSGSPFARAPIRNKKFLSLRWGFGEEVVDDGEASSVAPSHGDDETVTMRARSSGGDGETESDVTAREKNGSSHSNTAQSSSLPFPAHTLRQPPTSSSGSSNRTRKQKAPAQPLPLISIPVGHSRLYTVHFPSLTLHPIYWSPVGDVAPVIRGTWFYKNTMLPLEPQLANRLEEGYRYMRPWTETWQDEMDSCVENGADAEEKIVWKLFGDEIDSKDEDDDEDDTSASKGQEMGTSGTTAEEEEEERQPKKRAGLRVKFKQSEAAGPAAKTVDNFKTSSVIYVNSRDAQILRPNLLPSASRGRRPLSAIRKGREIGIPVVRGFDRKLWDKVHPPKLPATSAKRLMRMYQPRGRGLEPSKCPGCQLDERKPRPTDLVLVIHGIGQKLSERVESFSFTHHINAFRRQVNLEMNEDSVWPNIRDEMEGMMVLPVNWRAILSREDEDVQALTNDDPSANNFSLKDITPDTVPYVRNLISDVMLDIPYYLSDHKPKMIAAVTREANRIYRLWCANNPGFQENGRTHLIAHSLGSVMAVDILSKQPTRLPPSLDLSISGPNATPVSEETFEFDTRNLFLCGSPAGFFLLLNKGTLLPRRGRNKPGSDRNDLQKGITGEQGTYGCLAVDNLYNIMHDTDPISYCLNAAVDSDLAATLKPAFLPSSQTTWMQSLSNAFSFTSVPAAPERKVPDPRRRSRQSSQSAAAASTPGKARNMSQSQSQSQPHMTSSPNLSLSLSRTCSPMTPSHPFFSPSAASFDHDGYNPSDPDSENPLTQLPSNVEMETHDFTREEIAERRMYLLNDNGQIDYYMCGNAGPLSIQYLNMLSAHTSYWGSVDFIRLLVLEIGRRPGRRGTVAALRARKKKGWKGE